MFIPWYDKSIRLTGRWSDMNQAGKQTSNAPKATVTTAPGSYFELAFKGKMVVLQFDLGFLVQPYPHLWLSVDGGDSFEAPVDRYLRVRTKDNGAHVLRVSYKSGMEMLPRWYAPQVGAVAFMGAHVEAVGELPQDHRRIIEFIGDSITEGVLIDPDFDPVRGDDHGQFNRVYQDDNAANYATLTAQMLDLRPIYQAYGAVGLTKGGCGGVPRAGLLYPYVYDGKLYEGELPELIVINHGANDRDHDPKEYLQRYEEFLDMVIPMRPQAKVVILGAFCGAFDEELCGFVPAYNEQHHTNVTFISTKGWVPEEPLHPLRDGHQIIADHLAPLLKDILE